MKKAIAYILAFILFSASSQACTDKASITLRAEVVTVSLQAQSHDHKNERQDACSPLCICSCCSVTQHELNQTEFVVENPCPPRAFDEFFLSSPTSSMSASVWQPPRA